MTTATMTTTTTTTTETTAPMIDGERDDLLAALRGQRGFLRYAVRDLGDDRARERPTVSELSLGGLVKHVTEVERRWMEFVRIGPAAFPSVTEWTEEAAAARTEGFRLLEGETLDGVLDEYDRAAAATEEMVLALESLDVSHPLPEAPWFEPGAHWSARMVLLHILRETAQHCGHADIIRETLDGQKTMG